MSYETRALKALYESLSRLEELLVDGSNCTGNSDGVLRRTPTIWKDNYLSELLNEIIDADPKDAIIRLYDTKLFLELRCPFT